MERTQDDAHKDRVIAILKANCMGRVNAKSNVSLAEKIGITRDKFRQLCGDIVREKKLNIGSHPDHGFYVIVDQEDFDLSQRQLKSRVTEIAKRFHAAEEMFEETSQERRGNAQMMIKGMIEQLNKKVRREDDERIPADA
ncbi:MAG TPA: hypothetical protein P5110_07435 [Candidatus Omnitrophota bacterium]|nr:hypothetical protein [Candidatus Omnitrophota bacterium]